MVKSLTGGYKLDYHPEGPDGPVWQVDYSPPFRRLDMLPELEKALNCKMPKADELHTPGMCWCFMSLPS